MVKDREAWHVTKSQTGLRHWTTTTSEKLQGLEMDRDGHQGLNPQGNESQGVSNYKQQTGVQTGCFSRLRKPSTAWLVSLHCVRFVLFWTALFTQFESAFSLIFAGRSRVKKQNNEAFNHTRDWQSANKKIPFFSFLFPQKAVLRKTIHLLYVPCLPARLKVQEKERHQNIYIKANQSPSPASGTVGLGSDHALQQGKPCSGWLAPHCSSSHSLPLFVSFFSFPVLPSLLPSLSRSFLPLDMIL